jgi:hypothetical protein
MNELPELQRRCLAAFIDGDTAALEPYISPSGIPERIRIEVYENNVREGSRKALANAYPVIERLVGNECFRGLAMQYPRIHPSRSGDLQHFGADFPKFLDDLYSATGYCYLPDVARLEWAIESALVTRQPATLSIDELARYDPAEHDQLELEIAAEISLIQSPYPVLEIWKSNRAGDLREIDLGRGSCRIAICRNNDEIELHALSENAWQLALQFRRGSSLIESIEAIDYLPEFDLGQSLNELFTARCLTGLAKTPVGQ